MKNSILVVAFLLASASLFAQNSFNGLELINN
ncbi:MAG: hypothetical protein RL170_362 [Bacteroidota bacterium]|jgi:predicted small secreted protein